MGIHLRWYYLLGHIKVDMDIQRCNFMNDPDIEIELIPEPNEEIILTDTEVEFDAKIINTGDSVRNGIIPLFWMMANSRTMSGIRFEVEPNSTKSYEEIFSVHILQTGNVECFMPAPQINGQNLSPEEIEEFILENIQFPLVDEGSLHTVPEFFQQFLESVGHVICQFKVRDRATVENERERRKEQMELLESQQSLSQQQKDLNSRVYLLTVALLLLTLIMAAPILIDLADWIYTFVRPHLDVIYRFYFRGDRYVDVEFQQYGI